MVARTLNLEHVYTWFDHHDEGSVRGSHSQFCSQTFEEVLWAFLVVCNY